MATFYSTRLDSQVRVPKGACVWFVLHNPHDQKIRKCRNGFMCPYHHITQQEVEEIVLHGEDKVECPTCVLHQVPVDPGLDRMRRIEEQARRIFHRDSCRPQTRTSQILQEASRRAIDCECPTKPKATFYPKDCGHRASNCWICDQCHCIQSIG